jgi:predicted metal-dependent enzyme (double-stranded beta helix superfamily)
MPAFDIDAFVGQCRDAVTGEAEPWSAVREVLEASLGDRASVAAALPVERAELAPLHIGDDITVVKVVWAPGMVFPPHDHLTWACNGLYAGTEHNTLFELDDDGLRPTGEFVVEEGGIGVLDADAIHAVRNPDRRALSAAIHVYGGNFPSLPRTNWMGDPPRREPASIEATQQMFAAANERIHALDPR